MIKLRPRLIAVAALVAAAAPLAIAQPTNLSGKDVVDAVCAKCHASGANGARSLCGSQKRR